MTSWADLPRDLHLRIIKHLDIDTRIKAGIVTRLRVPKALEAKLSAVCGRIVQGRTRFYYLDSSKSFSSEADLGSRARFVSALNLMLPVYTLFYYPAAKRVDARWQVNHYVDDTICSYSLYDNKWSLTHFQLNTTST